ncbi:MAG: hypothetical protein JNN15_19110 [Blastocatellia bacterium]|nr:hypothetical protein [Blastocatellia bacterium]
MSKNIEQQILKDEFFNIEEAEQIIAPSFGGDLDQGDDAGTYFDLGPRKP